MLNLRCCSAAVGLEPGTVGSSEKGEWLQPGKQVNSSREAVAGEKKGGGGSPENGKPEGKEGVFLFFLLKYGKGGKRRRKEERDESKW